MKKIITLTMALIMALSLCACTDNSNEVSTNAATKTSNTTAETIAETTAKTTEIELTVDNIEQYLSFEVSKEMSEYNSSGADHILKIRPLVEGDFSGVKIEVTIPLYDHWYNSYTKAIDLTSDITLTKAGAYTAKHSIFRDDNGNYQTRGAQGEDEPAYIINSVSGTVK